jgi:hypothetical protein
MSTPSCFTSTTLAEQERRMISQRTKEALAAVRAKGVQLGGLRDYGREAKRAAIERAKALAPLFEELAGKSAREIARILNDRNIATPTGRPWSAVTVNRARSARGLRRARSSARGGGGFSGGRDDRAGGFRALPSNSIE